MEALSEVLVLVGTAQDDHGRDLPELRRGERDVVVDEKSALRARGLCPFRRRKRVGRDVVLLGLMGIEHLETVAGPFRRNPEATRDVTRREREVEVGRRAQIEAKGGGVTPVIAIDVENSRRPDVTVLEEDAGLSVPPRRADPLLVGAVVPAAGESPGGEGAFAARREELDDGRHRVRTVQSALGPPDDLHAADAHRRDVREVERPAALVHLHPVDEHEIHVAVAAASEDAGGAAAASALDQREAGLFSQHLQHVHRLSLLDLLTREHADGRAGLPDRRLGLGRRHHNGIHRSRWILGGYLSRTAEHECECQNSDDPRHLVLSRTGLAERLDSPRACPISPGPGLLAPGSSYSPPFPASRGQWFRGFRPRLQLRGSAGLAPASLAPGQVTARVYVVACYRLHDDGFGGFRERRAHPRPSREDRLWWCAPGQVSWLPDRPTPRAFPAYASGFCGFRPRLQ